MLNRRVPPLWSQAGESGTRLLYQPEQDPVIYNVPITSILGRPSILGRLFLVPAGDQGTIPAAMRNSKSQLFKYGECNKVWSPGSDSKLYYINQWAMCRPSDHIQRGP